MRGAALVNLAAAALALRLRRHAPVAAALPAADDRLPTAEETKPDHRMALLLPAVALSGFLSMGYEVLWTKAIAFFISNTAYAFSAMLTTFLLGLGVGGVLVGTVGHRWKRLWFGFGLIEVLIGTSALASLVIFATLSTPDRFDNSSATPVWFKFAYSFLVMFVPTVLMGMLLPLAGRILVRRTSATGRGVGRLYRRQHPGLRGGRRGDRVRAHPLAGHAAEHRASLRYPGPLGSGAAPARPGAVAPAPAGVGGTRGRAGLGVSGGAADAGQALQQRQPTGHARGRIHLLP